MADPAKSTIQTAVWLQWLEETLCRGEHQTQIINTFMPLLMRLLTVNNSMFINATVWVWNENSNERWRLYCSYTASENILAFIQHALLYYLQDTRRIYLALLPSDRLLFINWVPFCYLVNDWMSFEYLTQSDYWPKYHFQHSPSVRSPVNLSLAVSISASLKFHTCLCSALCSFHLKYQGKASSLGGWFLFQHTPPHPRCHLIDSEQRKQLSGSGSGAQLYLSSKVHEFPVTVQSW